MRELRRRKVRFPLIVSDNIKIRRLEELKQHPDIRAILSSYEEGKLITWLRDRYEDEVADNIEALDKNSCDFGSDLLACLGIQANVQIEELSAVALSNEKKNSVKRITADPELIKEFDHFAFNNEQLEWLLKSNAQTIYLPEGTFELNVSLRPVTIIGIKNPTIDICSYSFNDLRRAGVKCSDITLTSGKMRRVESITEDEYIRSNFECVAFDDDEFESLMKSDVHQIWLYGEHFTLKAIKYKVTVKGINIPELNLGKFSFNDLTFKKVEIENIRTTSERLEQVKLITDDSEIIDNFECVAFDNYSFHDLLKMKFVKKIWLYGSIFALLKPERSVEIIGINNVTIDLVESSFNELKEKNVTLSNVNCTSVSLEKVRGITSDEHIINNFEKVAFDDDEFESLMKSDVHQIWLYGEHFTLKAIKNKVTVKGINIPVLNLGKFSFNDLTFKEVEIENIRTTSKRLKQVKRITDDSEIIDNFECVAFDNYSFHDLLKMKFVKKIWLYGSIFALLKPERSVEIIGINNVTIDLVESSFNELKEKNVTLSNVNCTSVSLEKVRGITSDEHIINNFEKVAFTDDELKKLMQNSKYSSIYLYGDCFRIPYINRHINIKGINSPHVEFENGKTFDDYYKNGIKLTDVIPTTGAVNTDMLSVGKEFYFGTYDNEQIKWIVISQTKEKITALAVNLKLSFALESSFNNYQWKNSSLRKWLNREFYNSAFNVFEQFQMIEAEITCQEQNTRYEVQDKVYILSKDEIDQINDKDIRHVLKGSWLRKAEHTWGYADIFDSYGSFQFKRAYKQYGVIPVITLKNLNK